MFYVKTNVKGTEVSVPVTSETIFLRCTRCGCEEQRPSSFGDFAMDSSASWCKECRDANQHRASIDSFAHALSRLTKKKITWKDANRFSETVAGFHVSSESDVLRARELAFEYFRSFPDLPAKKA